ncbi:MAG TPA: hypothetical protein VF416_10935 [Marmoricola sp.]|jgi:hypothetical protein
MTTTPQEPPEIIPGTSRPIPVDPQTDPGTEPATEPDPAQVTRPE